MSDVTDTEIRSAEAERCAALSASDGTRLGRLLSDDFLYVHASGRTEDKQAYVASIDAKTFRLAKFEHDETSVRSYGDAALMSGLVAVTREEAGASRVTPFRFAALWVRQEDGWRLGFWQNTKA